MKKLLIAVIILCGIGSAFSYAPAQSRSDKAEITRNINIFTAILKELQVNYVDTIDAKKLVRTAITSMLNKIDPYTEYYPSENSEDLTSIASGQYGGIGAVLSKRNNRVIVSQPMWDSPARLAGLRHGDVILSVDNLDASNDPDFDAVSRALRGAAGSHVLVKVCRPYAEDSILTFDITRRTITMTHLPYYGIDSTGIGYIRLTTFNEHSAGDVKKAIIELKRNANLRGLVLDLRDNGGGLLESAVSIVGLFVPKGTEVVRTRGFEASDVKIYKTTSSPIDVNIPLAVLINDGTASSSEIVSGSLQDLDRAIIIGERSFGKGLVQSSRELPYGGMLKVTVARYYIPSGRLIQAIDYSHRNPDGSVARIPDSLTTVWHTHNGREVRDGGGITPDIAISDSTSNSLIYTVANDYWAFDYANRFVSRNAATLDPVTWQVTDSIFEDFKAFINPDKFKYDRMSESAIKYLRDVAKFEGYLNDSVSAQIDNLDKMLHHDLQHDLDFNHNLLIPMLDAEIGERYFSEADLVRRSLKYDEFYDSARTVLLDAPRYKTILRK
jgi:carboxyl-terminal processing protease